MVVRGVGEVDQDYLALGFVHNSLKHSLPEGLREELEQDPNLANNPGEELLLRMSQLGLLAMLDPRPINTTETYAFNHRLYLQGKLDPQVFRQLAKLLNEQSELVFDLDRIKEGLNPSSP